MIQTRWTSSPRSLKRKQLPWYAGTVTGRVPQPASPSSPRAIRTDASSPRRLDQSSWVGPCKLPSTVSSSRPSSKSCLRQPGREPRLSFAGSYPSSFSSPLFIRRSASVISGSLGRSREEIVRKTRWSSGGTTPHAPFALSRRRDHQRGNSDSGTRITVQRRDSRYSANGPGVEVLSSESKRVA